MLKSCDLNGYHLQPVSCFYLRFPSHKDKIIESNEIYRSWTTHILAEDDDEPKEDAAAAEVSGDSDENLAKIAANVRQVSIRK